jgi:large subunit ribosomal protein L9
VKVLLKRSVESLGSGGEVVRVKPGYARNYLLPKGLAVPATAGNLARVVELKRIAAQQAEEEIALAKDAGVRIGAVSVQIERAAGEEDRMWGSVTARDIEEAFDKLGVKLDRKRIQLPDPIKTFGPAEVAIRLHANVLAMLKIEVVKKA